MSIFHDWDQMWKCEACVSLKSFCETKYRSSKGFPRVDNSLHPDLKNAFLQLIEEKSTALEDIDELD